MLNRAGGYCASRSAGRTEKALSGIICCGFRWVRHGDRDEPDMIPAAAQALPTQPPEGAAEKGAGGRCGSAVSGPVAHGV
ncbi:hypothetical protein KCP76_01520 [Salmonella enterica subsp. enterica serovar Weltevreden]|nr:hypothetical protein KCP76_01520 [Salmonella enterica subsp. enterica serovar Weltevreden]